MQQRQGPDPEWLGHSLFQPRRPLSQRAARAVAGAAGRVAAAESLAASVLRALRNFGVSDYTWTVELAATLAFTALIVPVPLRSWPRIARWPLWRRLYLAIAAVLTLTYLPVAVYWLPPWRALGALWFPAAWLTLAVAAGMWAWLYYGHYRIREVEEDEPGAAYGPVETWSEHVGGQGGLLPGSVLLGVHDIEAPA